MIERILKEEDYIRSPKFGNSLNRFISNEKNANGVSDAVVARLLLMTEEEVQKIYQEAVGLLRESMVD